VGSWLALLRGDQVARAQHLAAIRVGRRHGTARLADVIGGQYHLGIPPMLAEPIHRIAMLLVVDEAEELAGRLRRSGYTGSVIQE